jgi:thioredoxin reductase (NADPH)
MHDVLIIGAGPAGLSCAIEVRRAGLSALVLEQGSVTDAIRRFPAGMVWFSTPELLEIGGVPFIIPTVRPTRVDTLRYYQRVATLAALEIRCHDPVTGIRKEGEGFTVLTARGLSHKGRTVVIATGYFDNPNRLGVRGEDLPHVRHYYDEPFRYAGSRVVIIGGRNSAVEAALDLYRNGAQVTVVHRGEGFSPGVKYWILPDIQNRIAAEQVKAVWNAGVSSIRPGEVIVRTAEAERSIPADFVFVLIGFGPDTKLLRAAGVELHPDTLAPVANEATLETTVRGLYVAGSVVAGKNNNKIFVENGRLHGRIIAQAIAHR